MIHYDFTYNVDNTGIATVDANDHHATGVAEGKASVTVIATAKTDWIDKDYYSAPDAGTYEIRVVANDGDQANYEVIYDDTPTSDTHTNRMGKLHFIKEGKFVAGQSAYQKVPGVNITFGNASDNYMEVVRSDAKVTTGGQGLENEKTSNRDISKNVVTIDKGTGNLTIIGSTADKDQSDNSIDNRVKVWAKVWGEKKSNDNQVVKTPQYLLRISDIPIYMLTDDEDKPQVIPQPGQRVSTTNILTRMWMTYGGWEHSSDDHPYYKNNDPDAYPDLMYDGWKPAKMDSVGSNNRTINGFKVASYGEQNPTAENVRSWSSNDKNTFALPVRGAYVKFEL